MSEIPIHSRVALVDGADNVYQYALSGTEGWIRDSKTDEEGFDLVRVEWDRDHWRYNGQPDGWTFESHFKVVGPPSPPAPEEEKEEQDDENVISFDRAPATDEQVEIYIESLSEAFESASESEAFLMIAVRRIPNPANPEETMYVPEVYMNSTTPEGHMLLDIQLAECAADSYEQMMHNLMSKLKGQQ